MSGWNGKVNMMVDVMWFIWVEMSEWIFFLLSVVFIFEPV
jgi:hypothetical protein